MVGVITGRRPEFGFEALDKMTAAIRPSHGVGPRRHANLQAGLFVEWFEQEDPRLESISPFREIDGRAILFCGSDFRRPEESSDPAFQADVPCTEAEVDGGEGWLRNRNGWFFGLVVDKPNSRITLFNDRFGMERCYLWEGDDTLLFSSDAKAILRAVPESRAFDLDGVAEQVTYGCTLQNRTLFNGISRLPAASCWTFEKGTCVRKSIYFNPREWEDQEELLETDFHEQFRQTFSDVVRKYRGIEGSVGLSLTGGWDSRMILAGWNALPGEVPCYTFCGETGETKDLALARKIAAIARQEHHPLRLDDDFFNNFSGLAEETVRVTSGACGLWDSHEIFLNRKAREIRPVRMTGNFGSEVIREVNGFKDLGLDRSLLLPDFLPHMDRAKATMEATRPSHPVTFAAFREIPWRLWGTVRCASSQVVFRTPYMDNELLALLYRAPKRLRRGTAVPERFVKTANVGLAKLPTDRGPSAMSGPWAGTVRRLQARMSFKADYWLSEGMPSFLIPCESPLRATGRLFFPRRHKYLQYRTWFRERLSKQIAEIHSVTSASLPAVFDKAFSSEILGCHLRAEANFLSELNTALSLGLTGNLLSIS